jgi:hypothetical protein
VLNFLKGHRGPGLVRHGHAILPTLWTSGPGTSVWLPFLLPSGPLVLVGWFGFNYLHKKQGMCLKVECICGSSNANAYSPVLAIHVVMAPPS